VYEGGIRVPAVANWPGTLPPGQVEAPIHIVDWMPTLCGLVRYRPERDLGWDGRDVWSLIDGSATKAKPRSLYWKAPNFSAVRLADWKLVVRNNGRNAQLFDLACDPHETQDLAGREPERVTELLARWKQYCADDR
jgi:arylsulfatase A-like enzyme